jgi:protein transport protein SEC61 subunit gamma and related proteins
MVKLKTWFNSQKSQYVRLWRIMKKPSMDEFKMIAKVSAVGVLLLGLIGFLINLIMTLIK